MSYSTEPNREEAARWNEVSGPVWVEMQSVLDRMLAPFAERLIDAARPREGARGLGIGCGAGGTTLEMARRVGAGGRCLGADISSPLVQAAKARAAAEGVFNADFVRADAQTYAFQPAHFDAVISRFGVMFFDDPEAAFTNIARAVQPGGSLTFVAWRSPAENPFMSAPARAVAALLPDLIPPTGDGPGQFAYADGERVRRILEQSGWKNADTLPIDLPCAVGEEDLPGYVVKLGPVGLALRNVDATTRARATEVARAALAPYVKDGEARFTSACWLVSAVSAR